MAGVTGLHGLITKVALRAYGCLHCKAEHGEPCTVRGSRGLREAVMHAGRWAKAERLLRPHTHPGLFVRRPR